MVRLIKRSVKSLLGTFACERLVSRFESARDTRTNLLRVLTYHRIDYPESAARFYPGTLSATPDEFRWQMEYVAQHYHVVDIHAVLAAVRGEDELPPKSVLVSFDDAYVDFARHAWPVLSGLGMPAVLFVPTAFPGEPQRAFWWDRLQQAAYESGALATPAGRRQFRSLIRQAKQLPHDQMLSLVDTYCAACGARPAENHVLNWEQLRQLAHDGLDLAAHTRTHPLLTRVDPEAAVQEVVSSREDLHERVGLALPVFSYPGGAYPAGLSGHLADAGFEVAFTTRRGMNDLSLSDPLRLRRINVAATTPRTVVRAQLLAGMRHFDPFWKD